MEVKTGTEWIAVEMRCMWSSNYCLKESKAIAKGDQHKTKTMRLFSSGVSLPRVSSNGTKSTVAMHRNGNLMKADASRL